MNSKLESSDKHCKAAVKTMLNKVKGNILLMNEDLGNL